MACLLFPCESQQQQTMVVTKDTIFWFFTVFLYKCHYEDILFHHIIMESFTNSNFHLRGKSLHSISILSLFKMTNIGKHQAGRCY